MILENKGEAFEMFYDNRPFQIPEGKFEVEAELGNHIIASTRTSHVNIVVVEGNSTKPGIKPAITPEAPVQEAPATVDEGDGEEEVTESEEDKE